MSKQLRAALLTWRRPIPLAMGFVFALTLVMAVWFKDEPHQHKSCYPRVDVKFDRSVSAEALARLYRSGGRDAVLERLAGVTDLRLDAGWMQKAPGHVRRDNQSAELLDPVPGGLVSLLPDCPNLRRVWLGTGSVSPEALKVIGTITQLEELSLADGFVHSRPKRPRLFELLRGLRNLKALDLTGFHLRNFTDEERERLEIPDEDYPPWSLSEELPHLSELPALRMLSLCDARYVDAATLRELSKLTQVETLAVDMVIGPSPGEGLVSRSDVEQLQAMAGLRTLYVPINWNAPELCRELLPGVSVRRGRYDTERSAMVVCVLFELLVLMFLATGEIICCSLNSLAPATPRYLTVHLRAAGIVVGIIILTATLTLTFGGADVLPALALCCGWVAAFTFLFEGQIPARDDRRMRPVEIFCAVLQGPSVFILFFVWMLVPHWIDAWLAGDSPLAAGGVLIGSLLVFRRLPSVVRRAVHHARENGLGSVASWQGFLQFQKGRAQRRKERAAEPGGASGLEATGRLESTLKSLPAEPFLRRLTLLRAGNERSPYATFRFALMLLVFLIIVGAVPWILGRERDSSRLIMPVSIMLLIIPLGIISEWRNRMSHGFSLELLRPVTRRDLRRLFFKAFAFDLLPVFVLTASVSAGLAFSMETVHSAVATTILLAAAGILVYGIGLWAIMIRRTWVIAIIGLTFLLAWQVTLMAVLLGPAWDQAAVFAAPAAIAVIIGAASSLLAWHHWLRREMA